jgi:hypothetical protein
MLEAYSTQGLTIEYEAGFAVAAPLTPQTCLPDDPEDQGRVELLTRAGEDSKGIQVIRDGAAGHALPMHDHHPVDQ